MRIEDVRCLERHAYAPEMNKLHMNSGIIHKAPQCTTIEQAVSYIKNITQSRK